MIETLAQLRSLYAEPAERALRKQRPALDLHCQRFIALSPFCVVASSGAVAAHGGPGVGLLDASPRGGAPGFAKTPDAHTLLLPDSGGNNRLDTLTNLLADPRIGLLFMIPGVDETLRVNGRALLSTDPDDLQRCAEPLRLPKLAIRVTVQACYLHCAKALMRSELWSAEARVSRNVMPTLNQMIQSQMGMTSEPESQELMVARYSALIAAEQSKKN